MKQSVPHVTQDFIMRQNFLPAEDCAALIACFERNRELLFRNPQGDPFWDNRYLWITSLSPEENQSKRVIQTARMRVIEQLQAFYRESSIYSDTVQLVKWSPGMSMPPHADNAHPDGSPHAMPWRDYASVIYLNDDYGGGEFYFPGLGIEVKPETGMCWRSPVACGIFTACAKSGSGRGIPCRVGILKTPRTATRPR